MQYLRLRSPKEHGESLQIPLLSEAPAVWQTNLNHSLKLDQRGTAVQQELAQLAFQYSRTYSNVDDLDQAAPIVFAGHQPALFHCGVWYKNFALSNVARTLGATAINLVVDNDLCAADSILFPEIETETSGKIESARLKRLAIDDPSTSVPYENRLVENEKLFASFRDRAHQAIKPIVNDPIVNQLWPEVLDVHANGELRLGHCLAAGRHRLEQAAGLKTLELPISLLAKSQAFAEFAAILIERRAEMQQAYNESLLEYRSLHSIRSSAHPVPMLETEQEWTEVPLWVWHQKTPLRKRLFVRDQGSNLELTDRDQWSESIPQNSLAKWMHESDVCIRPKALTTTMFCRAYCGGLFLHGIGGAKYDQLNDSIMKKFWGQPPPPYLTLSATMRLPANFDNVSSADLTALEQNLRDLRFHPEKFVSENTNNEQAVQELVGQKMNLIAEANSKSAIKDRKKRHDAIESVNQLLQPFVETKRQELVAKQDFSNGRLRTSQILGSREFSFALFSETTIGRLKEMAY